MDFNKVIIAGRLVAKPELKELPSGDHVANFRIAANHRWKDQNSNQTRDEACFIDAKCYGKRAPVIENYFHKGSQILLEGRLRQEIWEKEGEKKSRHVILVDNFSFVDRKQGAGSSRDSDPGDTMDTPPTAGLPSVASAPLASAGTAAPGSSSPITAAPGGASPGSAAGAPAAVSSPVVVAPVLASSAGASPAALAVLAALPSMSDDASGSGPVAKRRRERALAGALTALESSGEKVPF